MGQNQQRAEGKRSQADAPATTMEVDLAVVQAHAQWGPPELKAILGVNPSASVEGVDGVSSAWVADECNRVLGQELPQEEEDKHVDLANAGKQRELAAWGKFEVVAPRTACHSQQQIIQTRWAITWNMADGGKCAKARLVAKGFLDPGLREGLVDTSGCLSLRSSHLQVVSLSATRQ